MIRVHEAATRWPIMRVPAKRMALFRAAPGYPRVGKLCWNYGSGKDLPTVLEILESTDEPSEQPRDDLDPCDEQRLHGAGVCLHGCDVGSPDLRGLPDAVHGDAQVSD